MCQNVPPLELYQDEMFNALRSTTWQNAVTRICVRLHKYGDGYLSDEWLLKGLFRSRKSRDAFLETMAELPWFVRGENGHLCRAGMLAPLADADQHHDQGAVSQDALRMQIKRAVRAELEVAGLAHRTPAEHLGRSERTEYVGRTNGITIPREQTAEHRPNERPNSELEFNSKSNLNSGDISPENSIPFHSNSEGPETAVRTETEHPPDRPPLSFAAAPQSSDVVRVLMTAGFTESECGKILKECPVSTIVDGIECLQGGGWPKSKDDKATLKNYFAGRLTINSHWKTLREAQLAASGQTAAVMSIDGGRPRKTEAERMAEEEAERKAKQEAIDIARARIRPGGIKATGS